MGDLSSDLAALRIDDEPTGSGGSGGSAFVKMLLWIVLLGVGAGGLYYGVWPKVEAQMFKSEVTVSEIAVVSPAQAAVNLTASGYVAAERSSKVAPKVPGTVKAVFVKQSDDVKAGALLLEMDPTDEKAAVTAAKSRAAAAYARAQSSKAQIDTSEAQLAEIRQQAARERKLAEEGISPRGVANDLEARVESLQRAKGGAEAAYRAAQAEANALSAEVKVLETTLGNLQLVAPIDGRIMNKPPQVGEFVGPQPAGVAVDMGGVEIADFSTLVVEVDVPEQRLHLVAVGGPTEIVLDAYPQKRLRGKVREITPKVDRAKATVMVKVEFQDRFEGVLPEMAARVSFLSGELDDEAIKEPPKTIIPRSAVTQRAGADVAFVLEGEQVRMVPVTLGPEFGRGFELVEGPRPGTRVISEPSSELTDGQRVKERELE